MPNPYRAIEKRFKLAPLEPSCQPIFIFSSSWRSGSTLLQRSLCTDPSMIVWGEPYSDCNSIQSMATTTRALLQKKWPIPGSFVQKKPEVFQNLHKYFIANMYPQIEAFRQSHRLFLDNLFWTTARAQNFSRFGIKFVRLGLAEAQFLRWMYPDCIFLFLVRNPWDSWRSYKGYRWRYRYPKPPVTKVELFASIWQKHTSEFLQFDLKNAGWIRYEEFIQPEFNWDRLRTFCDLPNMTTEALSIKIAGVDREPSPVTQEELDTIQYVCGDLTQKLGYLGLGKTDLTMKPFP